MIKRGFQKVRIGKRKSFSKANSYLLFTKKGILIAVAFFFLIPLLAGGIWFYSAIIKNLPDMSEIDNLQLSQATVITDKNDIVLYKLFEENRTYVSFDKISTNMVNAIIAGEDKYFWTNPGIDVTGIARAGIKDVLHMEKKQGASTITQQLIKELILSREKTWTRKLKEMVLAIKLNDHIRAQIKSKYYNISSDELDKMVKEKILEIYLNYVLFSNNAYGVESASKMYFGTSAQNLDVIQASILAGIPNAPGKYNPYSNKASVVGETVITLSGEKIKATPELNTLISSKFRENLDGNTFTFSKDSQNVMNKFLQLGKFQITYSGEKYDIEYKLGRKDFILARMFEDNYIDNNQLKDAFIKGLNFDFTYQKIEIKAPHFVYWVINDLKEQYGEDLLTKGGLVVKTSLDYNIQQIAENSVATNMAYIKSKGANNAAFVYLDSKSGDIISYVGSADFNNKDIDGQVDILQATRQPGSTVKPLLYSLGFMKNALTIDSPIYDLPLKIGKDSPENVDGGYNGLMPIKRALAGSRNLPAIKMYFAVGEEREFKSFLKSLGMSSLSDKVNYGYPMAIGGAETKPLELANAYAHLSAMGQPAKIDPILEIRNSDGSILYRKKVVQQTQIIPSGVAYMIWKIVSDKANLPASWVSEFSFDGIKFGTKSGTTNVVLKNGKKLPRDGWLTTYTPSKVAVFWAGNTKGEPMHADSYGGWLNAKIRKSFFTQLKNKGLLKDEDMEEKEIKDIQISKYSGKVPGYDTPSSSIVNTIGYINNLPSDYDTSKNVKIDTFCNGKATAATPAADIVDGVVIDITPSLKGTKDTDDIKSYRAKNISKISEGSKIPIFLEEPQSECSMENRSYNSDIDRASTAGSLSVQVLKPSQNQNITRQISLLYQVNSNTEISEVQIYIDGNYYQSFSYEGKSQFLDIKNINLGNISLGAHTLGVLAKDKNNMQQSVTINVNVTDKDANPPYISQDNIKYSKNDNGTYNISLLFQDDESSVKSVKIYQDGKLLKTFDMGVVNISSDKTTGLTYEAEDSNGNIAKNTITVN